MATSLELHLDTVLPTDGTSLRAPEVSPFITWLARTLLKLMGWKLYGQMPDVDRCVIAAAPHTSNWDGIQMLLTAYSFGIRPRWIVKIEWTRGIIGPITRVFGGLGLDRRHSRDSVQGMVELINQHDRFALVIAPEGTRRKLDHWKTGFYWMAHGANVPLVLAFPDYKHNRIGIGPMIMPTGDLEADMEKIWTVYRQTQPRHPERMSEMRLRPSQVKKSADALDD